MVSGTDGAARPGHVTMQDVAARAGVSIKTVSNVVNAYPYIRAATRERVEAAIAELGYQLNVSARNLRQGRTGMIALVVPELRLPYFAELADSVIEVAEASGVRVLLEQTGGRREREEDVLQGRLRHLVDGVIFSPLELGEADRDRFAVDFPLVVLGEAVFGSAADHVTMSNVAGAEAATAHLLARGRRRVLALGASGDEPGVGSASLRLEGYRRAHAAAGVPVDEALHVSTGPWHRSAGATTVGRLLDEGVRFDAVFAFNDALAHGALHALHLRRVAVPDDVAVVGFDDVEESSFSTPTLTSVDAGREEIARRSVDLLLARVAERTGAAEPAAVDGPAFVEATFALRVRESSGGPVPAA